jgi:hypothetical protein
MILALLLLGSVVLRDEVSVIPPHHKWRYDKFVVTERNLPFDVDCLFHVEKGGHVHLELLTGENLDNLRAGRDYDVILSSQSGALHQEIGVPGTFAIVLWNDDETQPAEVALKLSLDFSGKSLNFARTLPPQRKLAVILISFAGFITILGVSARQLLKGMASRPQRGGNSISRTPDEERP